MRGYLGEGDRAHPAGGVAADLGGGQLGVPQGDEGERDEPAPGLGAAPLLHRPVVVGADAQQGELPVGGLGEGLAAEAGEGGEAEGGLDVVDVHVGEALRDVVRPRAHLLVGDDLQSHLLPADADGGVEAGEGAVQVLVDPPVTDRPLVAGFAHDGLEAAAEEGHLLQRGAHDTGAGVPVLLRQPVLPDGGGLHGVVVDGDDQREAATAGAGVVLGGLHGGHRSADLTDRQLSARRRGRSRACGGDVRFLCTPGRFLYGTRRSLHDPRLPWLTRAPGQGRLTSDKEGL